MNLVNVASRAYKCEVITATSSQNQLLHPPASVIEDGKDLVWISGEGLPQSLTLSLQNLSIEYRCISTVVFTCNHDYDTNPKFIEIWIAKDTEAMENGQFIFWHKVEMLKKRGRQMFQVSDIPESQRILRFIVTDTYGEYQTYINQVMLLAQPDQQTSQSLFNNEQWQPQVPIPIPSQKQLKKSQVPPSNPISKTRNQQSVHMSHQSQFLSSPLQLLKDVQNFQESQHRKKKNHNHNHQAKHEQFQLDDDQADEDRSYERNALLLEINRNMVVMEDNLQELVRKVNVLDQKVDYTCQHLEANIIKKMEEIIDKKIQRKLSEKQLEVNPRRNQRSCKDLTTSRTMSKHQITHSSKGREQQVQGQIKKKRKTEQKQVGNIYGYGYEMEKQRRMMSLVSQLNNKLKQRTKLTQKYQKRLKMSNSNNINKHQSQYYG